MKKQVFILIIFAGFLYCCNEVGSSEEIVEEEVVEGEIILADTLQLKEGKIPEKWTKVELQKGYYIGFPREPRKKEKRNRIDWKLRRNHYQFYVSITDLAKDTSFQDNKQNRIAYYQAIVDDLALSIEGEVTASSDFLSQEVYEGKQATIQAEDAVIYMRCVIIGTSLYSFGIVLFAEEKPAYLQLKEKFFHSFGKELYIIDPNIN